jgi:hypothetical protein
MRDGELTCSIGILELSFSQFMETLAHRCRVFVSDGADSPTFFCLI